MRTSILVFVALAALGAALTQVLKPGPPPGPETPLSEASGAGIFRLDDLLEEAQVVGPGPDVLGESDLVLWQWNADAQLVDNPERLMPSTLGGRRGALELEAHEAFTRISAPRRSAGAIVPVTPISGHELGLVVLEVRSPGVDEISIALGEEFDSKGLRSQPARLFVTADGEWTTVACTAEELGVAPGDGIDELAIIVPNRDGQPRALDVASIQLMSARSRYCAAAAGRAELQRQGVTRTGLYVNTSTALRYSLRVPRDGALLTHVTGADAGAFTLRVSVSTGEAREILFEEMIPGFHAERDLRVDVSAYADREVTLELEVVEREEPTVALLMHPLLAGRTADPRPNVLVYLCDTLRADALGCYGSPRSGTPNLDRLASEGVRFERCFAQAPWTYVSVPSSFTSLYPTANGVQVMGDELSDEIETWVEVFRREGYLTAGLVTNGFVGHMTHLEQGYDMLFEPSAIFGAKGNGSTLFVEEERPSSEQLNEKLEPWLDSFAEVPFFLFVHAVDPHEPYQPAETDLSEYVTPEEHMSFQRDYLTLRGEHPRPNVRLTRAEIAAAGVDPDSYARLARAHYDAEVAGFDRAFGELLDSLEKRELTERTLLAFTSDHGEEFLEHGVTSHAHSSYNELLHVPWIVRFPGVLPAGTTYSENTAALDLAPTVLALVGIVPPSAMQGRDLTSALLHHEELPPRTIYAEQWRAPTGVVTGEAFAFFEGDLKTISRRTSYEGLGQPTLERYDLVNDFEERHDLAREGVDSNALRVEVEARVKAWWNEQEELRARFQAGRAAGIPASAIESLRALGYAK